MTRRLAFVVAALAMALLGCIRTSASPSDVMMREVRGRDVAVFAAVGDDVVAGELLAVTDSSLVLLSAGRVVVAPIAVIRQLDRGPGWTDSFLVRDGSFSAADRRELTRLSRFPYGITSAAMTSLLAASNQAAPDRFNPVQR